MEKGKRGKGKCKKQNAKCKWKMQMQNANAKFSNIIDKSWEPAVSVASVPDGKHSFLYVLIGNRCIGSLNFFI